jgi:hypothetical protein
MLICYTNFKECLVMTPENEAKNLVEWFFEGSGRTIGDALDNFTRMEIEDAALHITAAPLQIAHYKP